MAAPFLSSRPDYLDYVDATVETLSEVEREALFNGCGTDGENLSWIGRKLVTQVRLPSKFQAMFRDACLWHDIAGHLGGTSKQKAWSDDEMFWKMKALAAKAHSTRGLWQATLAYLGVRAGWIVGVGWELRDRPMTFPRIKGRACRIIANGRA